MKSLLRIGLCGYMGSGKSLLVDMIREELAPQYRTAVIPFAKPLKEAARDLGWNGEKDAKGRRLLQLLGTECGRGCIHENMWVNKWFAAGAASDVDVIFSDDMRFINEFEVVDWTIKVKRSATQPAWWRRLFKGWFLHPSEHGFSDNVVSMVVTNDGDERDLRWIAKKIAKSIQFHVILSDV